VLSQTITTIICLSLSPDDYQAKIYVTQLVYFVYIFGYSIGQANSILTGRVCGMGDLDKADKMHDQNLRLVLFSNMLLSVCFLVLSKPMLRLFYDASDAIVAAAAIIFWIDIAVEFGRGMNHIGQFALNATGDVNFTTVISIVSCWACSVGLAFVFVSIFHWGLPGIWIAFAIDEFFRGTLYLIRWKRGTWRKSYEKAAL
jgi:Na+-driven multidrug efflux pump